MSVVSPRPGLLVAAAKTPDGALLYSTFMPPQGWDAWRQLPGTSAGGTKTCPDFWSSRCFAWNADSYPALSTRGPGLVELFIVANQTSFYPQPGDGQIALVHTWSDRIVGPSVVWSEDWESLGTGLLKGSPAAISWGPGRTDVLPAATSRGPGNVELFSYNPIGQLFQRTYNNGTWTERLTWTGGINASTVYWTPAF